MRGASQARLVCAARVILIIFRIKIFLKKSQTSSSRDMKSMLKIQVKTCLFICCCNMSL